MASPFAHCYTITGEWINTSHVLSGFSQSTEAFLPGYVNTWVRCRKSIPCKEPLSLVYNCGRSQVRSTVAYSLCNVQEGFRYIQELITELEHVGGDVWHGCHTYLDNDSIITMCIYATW